MILRETVCGNIKVADFESTHIWDVMEAIFDTPAIGGQVYDAFILEIVMRNKIEGFATFNPSHFTVSGIAIIDPSHPEQLR